MSNFPQGTVGRIIEIAIGEIGTVEQPDNLVKYNNMNGQPWCGWFINWCAKQAGVNIPSVVSTILGEQAFKNMNKLFTTPQVGDLAFFNFSGGKTPEHIGLVVKLDAVHGHYTIDGNTSSNGSQANGGEVMLKQRPNKFIVSYGRPTYVPATGALPSIPPKK